MLKVVPKFVPIQQTPITLCVQFGGNMYQAFIPVILNILTVCSRMQRKPETLKQIKCGHWPTLHELLKLHNNRVSGHLPNNWLKPLCAATTATTETGHTV